MTDAAILGWCSDGGLGPYFRGVNTGVCPACAQSSNLDWYCPRWMAGKHANCPYD